MKNKSDCVSCDFDELSFLHLLACIGEEESVMPSPISQINAESIDMRQKNDILDAVKQYDELDVKPILRIADLNNSEDNPCENESKSAIEIGLKFRF